MADKITAELGGKSKYEVAEQMAQNILFNFENNRSATRQQYLMAVYESINVLDGNPPSAAAAS